MECFWRPDEQRFVVDIDHADIDVFERNEAKRPDWKFSIKPKLNHKNRSVSNTIIFDS